MKVTYSHSKDLIYMSEEKFANLFLVNVVIAGEVIPLIFDTGGTKTAISEAVTKRTDVLYLSSTTKVGGNTGRIKTIPKGKISELKVGSNTIEDLCVIVVPDEDLDFGYDEEGNRLKAKGVLGWDVISKFRWTIDPIKRTFTVEESECNKDKELLHWDNMPIINAQYGNIDMYFGFDSGNTESMFGKEFIPFLIAKEKKIDFIAGVGDTVEEDVYVVNSIELKVSNKTLELSNISVLNRDVFPTTKFRVTGLLGADIIQKHKCLIDYANQDFQLF